MVAVETVREQTFAERDGLRRVHRFDACGAPVALRRFDDERRPVVIEAVGVEIEPAPFRLAEVERERIELDASAEPDEAIGPRLDIGVEGILVSLPRGGCRAVGRDDEIVLGSIGLGIRDFALEDE